MMMALLAVGMFGICPGVRRTRLVNHVVRHSRVRLGGTFGHAELVVRACITCRAEHGGRHRAPQGKQHGQQQQEAEANGFHKG